MSIPVKEFIADSNSLISASNPSVPLRGTQTAKSLNILNRLLSSFSGTGLNLTVSTLSTYVLQINQGWVTYGDATYTPTPDVIIGRLANCENAWLLLEGVTYPLIVESKSTFQDSYKYDPQVGLPRYAFIFDMVNLTGIRVYPAASQLYTLNVYGKFELSALTENSDMSLLPNYYLRYLQLALAKDTALYTGRASAWTQLLEDTLQKAEMDMQSISSINLAIQPQRDSYLNGAYRVRAGI
jgi:hypothetical protein